jgi:DNA invertase Pin-like site-specific DNA recombinase
MTLVTQVLAAFAEYERNIICERTRAGLARARRKGKVLGRPRNGRDPRSDGNFVREASSWRSSPTPR